MIYLNIPLNIPVHKLNEKYCSFVVWDKIPNIDIRNMNPEYRKYLPLHKLKELYPNSDIAGLTDEDILSICAREISKLSEQYEHSVEYRLKNFIHEFVSFSVVKKYFKQIN